MGNLKGRKVKKEVCFWEVSLIIVCHNPGPLSLYIVKFSVLFRKVDKSLLHRKKNYERQKVFYINFWGMVPFITTSLKERFFVLSQ